jgi:GNAT superfamily N-acetyltransferase
MDSGVKKKEETKVNISIELNMTEPNMESLFALQRLTAIPAWFLTKDGYWLYARLIHPEDEPRLLDFFDHLSSQTRRSRFHTNVDYLDAGTKAYHAHNFATVDNLHTGGAVVAVEYQGEEPGVVGVLRLGAPQDKVAEAAVVVRDDFQGRGVGRALLKRLPTLAQRMNVETVTATISADNLPALRLFRRLHLPMTSHTSHAETELRITMPASQSSTQDDPG